MESINKTKNIIIICILLILAALSFFWLSDIASSSENYTGTYASLDEKKMTVTALTGAAVASSAALSLLPGDSGTPIADEMADMVGYFMFILAAICLEKWMLTITGMLAFKIMIPIGFLVLIAARITLGETWRELGIKLILFALMMYAIVPSSVIVTEKIDESYQASMQQLVEDTRNDTEQIRKTAGDEQDEGILTKLFNGVKGGVSGTIDKFENTLNKIIESVAVLIVTSCVIPIAVFVFFLWLIKMITGVSIKVPNFRMSKVLNRNKSVK